jgi:hypothetical protein
LGLARAPWGHGGVDMRPVVLRRARGERGPPPGAAAHLCCSSAQSRAAGTRGPPRTAAPGPARCPSRCRSPEQGRSRAERSETSAARAASAARNHRRFRPAIAFSDEAARIAIAGAMRLQVASGGPLRRVWLSCRGRAGRRRRGRPCHRRSRDDLVLPPVDSSSLAEAPAQQWPLGDHSLRQAPG